MFGETTIFHVKIWNHPIETTILKWMFQVPGGALLSNFRGNDVNEIFDDLRVYPKPPLMVRLVGRMVTMKR